jgi:hypothetical protein
MEVIPLKGNTREFMIIGVETEKNYNNKKLQ